MAPPRPNRSNCQRSWPRQQFTLSDYGEFELPVTYVAVLSTPTAACPHENDIALSWHELFICTLFGFICLSSIGFGIACIVLLLRLDFVENQLANCWSIVNA
jgi:hypothetical protein